MQFIWELPEQTYQDEADYMRKYSTLQPGDKLVKGRGGLNLVLLKTDILYKKKKVVIQQAVKERVEEDGEDAITQDTMGMQMNRLVDELEDGANQALDTKKTQEKGASSSSRSETPTPTKSRKPAVMKESPPSASKRVDPLEELSDAQSGRRVLRRQQTDEASDEEPKSRRKATPQVAAPKQKTQKNAADGKPKKKGAPKRDAPLLLRAAVNQFKCLSPQKHYALFLGPEWKN